MILHIGAYSSKHILFPFIDFVNDNLEQRDHYHILCSKDIVDLEYPNVKTLDIFTQKQELLTYMNQADKIFLHGIWYDELCEIFYLNKYLLPKVFWILWGGEYFFTNKVSTIKKWLFKEIPYLITGSKDDYEFVKKTYNTKGQYLACTVIYPNNLYVPDEQIDKSTTIKILVGNSADPTNNHLDIFKKIAKFKLQDIELYIPLVYGDTQYAYKIEKEAHAIFGNKATILKDYINFNDYLSFLATIDIAIFNHKIQQAAGSIISLLGFGAKVYINSHSSLNNYFKEFDVKLYNNKDITLDLIDQNIKKINQKNMQKYFSKDILLATLENVFNQDIQQKEF